MRGNFTAVTTALNILPARRDGAGRGDGDRGAVEHARPAEEGALAGRKLRFDSTDRLLLLIDY